MTQLKFNQFSLYSYLKINYDLSQNHIKALTEQFNLNKNLIFKIAF